MFSVSPELLKDALHLPADNRIVGLEWDCISNNARLIVEGEDLPVVNEGELPFNVKPIVEVVNLPGNRGVEYIWDWGMSNEQSR